MMRQTAFTIMTTVKPGREDRLGKLLAEIGDVGPGNPRLDLTSCADLHYASFSIMADGNDDPFLLFEGNVDGRPAPFLKHLYAVATDTIDEIYEHCVGYPAPAADHEDHEDAVLAYLRAHDIGADTFYVAWPGHTVAQIKDERELRDYLRDVLDRDHRDLAGLEPDDIRAYLVQRVSEDPSKSWALVKTRRPFLAEHGKQVVWLVGAAAAGALLALVRTAASSPASRRRGRRGARFALGMLSSTAVGGVVSLRAHEAGDDRREAARVGDWQTTYADWSRTRIGIQADEDVASQNHLASIVNVRSGRFRRDLLGTVLVVINAAARSTATKGKLGGISSIHFARWVITPDGKQLIFLSNFDGSWESYLSDFIELAASGLTAVWSNTDNAVGFPRTTWLVNHGARDEARFKAYARYGMVHTRVWYSAYGDLSVSNIENNMLLRRDLSASLDRDQARAWLRRL